MVLRRPAYGLTASVRPHNRARELYHMPLILGGNSIRAVAQPKQQLPIPDIATRWVKILQIARGRAVVKLSHG